MRYLATILVLSAASLSLIPAPSHPPAKPRFTDVTAASGLFIAKNTGVGGTNPHAVAVEDFNGDGLPDIIIPTFGKPHVRYFKNLGNLKFQDITKGSGLEAFEGDGTGVAMVDFDRDGKLDIYMTSLRKGASRLFKGNGDGTFTDVSEKAGVLLKTPARSCSWCDVDGDGWVDLFITSPTGECHLFKNRRDGTFADIIKDSGIDLKGRHCLGCCFGDIDGDGLDDLFVTCYQSQPSALFKNLGGGKFKDISKEAGVDRKASSVGCVFADIFNTGRLDLYVSTDSWLSGANYTEPQLLKQGHTVLPNMLYANDGKGRFSPVESQPLMSKTLGHDIICEDLDHDGLVDIYVGVDAQSGNKWATTKGGNPLCTRPLITGGGPLQWREMAKDWGIKHEANCVCVPAVDFDNDGDLDLLLVNFYSNVVLYRNNTDDKNWLRVKAVGTKSNPDGIGAKVSVFAKDNLVGYRQIHSGAGYCRCSPLEAHFGLAKAADSYRVEVVFSGSKTRVVRDNIKPGQRLVIRESE
ncbi:MAG: CRTAC1 family protein [Planctomycetes bacterium]|nr:CRTAC1 family protein [Planctomycetota bacterium]